MRWEKVPGYGTMLFALAAVYGGIHATIATASYSLHHLDTISNALTTTVGFAAAGGLTATGLWIFGIGLGMTLDTHRPSTGTLQ